MFKHLRNPFKAPLSEKVAVSLTSAVLKSQSDKIENLTGMVNDAMLAMEAAKEKISNLEKANSTYQNQMDGWANAALLAQRKLTGAEAVITQLRKQRVYPGQKFYDPNNQKLPTVYLCARWNDWYMIRQSNQLTPQLLSAAEWQIQYGHYVVLPAMNANLKNIA